VIEQASVILIGSLEVVGQYTVHRGCVQRDEHRPLLAGWVDHFSELLERVVRLFRQRRSLALLVLPQNCYLVFFNVDVRPSKADSSIIPCVFQDLSHTNAGYAINLTNNSWSFRARKRDIL